MKVGIMLYSQSGHTALFGKEIYNCLIKAEIDTDIKMLRPKGVLKPFSRDVELRNIPETNEYDVLLIGGPVMVMKPSPVILSFIKDIDSLKGRKALSFVTHCLPFKFMGANQAIKKMNEKLDVLCAEILEGESLFCILSPKKEKMVAAAEKIVSRIKG